MKVYLKSRMEAAGYAAGIIQNLGYDSLLITITRLEKSGGYSVAIATTESLEDTQTETSSSKPEST